MTTRRRWFAPTSAGWATALFAFSCVGFAACSADDDTGSNDAPVTPVTGGQAQTTGGASTGGAATGGVSTGGTSTGGASTGGTSTGGSSTGGTATGGSGQVTGGAGGVGNSGGGGAGGQPGNKGGAGAGGMAAGGGGASSAGAGGGGASSGGGATGFQPCPATDPCKILPLGDSITDGIGTNTTGGGYRVELFNQAVMAGKKITFVGGSMNGPMMVAMEPFPRNHEGHSGWTISQIDGIVPSPALTPKPHIILLHIGTNDMYQMPNGAPDRLGTLIDGILSELPDSLLVVSTIIPFPQQDNTVKTFNSAVPGLVKMRADAGKHILLVDQFKDFPTSELGDGVHPNQTGYGRMGKVWYEAIKSYLP